MPISATSSQPNLQPVLGLPDPGERVPKLAWPTVGLYAGVLALFGLEAYGAAAEGWTPWVIVPMGAAVTFLMFSVLHEATHHAVSTRTWLNNLFGHVSLPLVAPYATFPMIKFVHIEHHRNTNEQKTIDPDHWTSEGPWWQLPFRWMTLDAWYVVYYLRRIRERSPSESVTTVINFVAVWTGIALLMRAFPAEIVPMVVGQRLGVLVLAWWFDYLPHHGLTLTQRQDKYQATRVRVGGELWLTPLFVYQNYHLVHHLHPSVPFYRYIRAWRRNEQAYLDRNAAISTWFGRSLTPSEYRTWRRLTDSLEPASDRAGAQRPVFHPLRVRSVEQLTEDSRLVTFDVPEGLAHEYRYVQGQHITLRAIVDGVEVRRSYSIVTSVSAGTLTVAVKQVPGGVFSTYVNEVLEAGDVLDVMSPTGRFHTELRSGVRRHYVAVAAGSGITPLMSIIATTREVEPESRFTLIYGNRTADSTMFREELEALADERLRVHHVRSREAADLEGRITPELVRSLVPEPVDTWFLCGPQALVDDLRAELGATERVLTEVFHTDPVANDVAVDVDSRVTVAIDGVETTFTLRSTGDTVLDAAMQHGLEPPYSCAGGACGTCRAKVMMGRAVMDQNHALDGDETSLGYVLTCQAHPVSEELRLDYDA